MPRIALSLLALVLGACSQQQAPADTETAPGTPATSDLAASGASGAAASTAAVSRYTALKDCTVVDQREDEDWSISRCAGPGGYGLFVDYGDARDDLRLLRAGAKPVELGLIALGGGGFNTLADTIEWRGPGREGAFTPTALIVRNQVVKNPEQPERQSAVLVVIDLEQGCAVAQVEAQSGQNEAARAIADGPKRPCLKGAD